jgi:hypothetical protein
MRGEPLDQSTLDNALHAVLDRYPTALLFALNAAAVRVPLPADGVFSARAELPGRDATVVNFVVAADRMTVVKAWERVKATGLAQEQVRMPATPSTPTLSRSSTAATASGSGSGPWSPRMIRTTPGHPQQPTHHC